MKVVNIAYPPLFHCSIGQLFETNYIGSTWKFRKIDVFSIMFFQLLFQILWCVSCFTYVFNLVLKLSDRVKFTVSFLFQPFADLLKPIHPFSIYRSSLLLTRVSCKREFCQAQWIVQRLCLLELITL